MAENNTNTKWGVKIYRNVLQCLIDCIVAEGVVFLSEHSKLKNGETFEGVPHTKKFGVETYSVIEGTLKYAVVEKIKVLYNQKGENFDKNKAFWKENYKLSWGYGAIRLYRLDKDIRNTKKQIFEVDKRFLQVYIEFLGFKTFALFLDKKLPDSKIRQFQLCSDYTLEPNKPLEFSVQNSELAKPKKGIVANYMAYSLKPGLAVTAELEVYSVETVFFDKERIDMSLRVLSSGEVFKGGMEIIGEQEYGTITLKSESKRNTHKHFHILIPNKSKNKIGTRAISIGSFIKFDKEQNSYGGLMVFQSEYSIRQEGENGLNEEMMRGFLINHQLFSSKIENDISTVADFKKSLEEFTNWREKMRKGDQLLGKYFHFYYVFEADGEYKIELSKLHVEKSGRVICTSIFKGDEVEYIGHFDVILMDKVVFFMKKKDHASYHSIIDIPSTGLKKKMDAIFAGITKENKLEVGRSRFYSVSKKVYENSNARVVERSEIDKKYPDLYDYLRENKIQGSGNLLGTTKIDSLSGVYYCFQTKTTKGHTRIIKKSPIVIDGNGDVKMKVKEDGEFKIIRGIARRNHDCLFIELNKEKTSKRIILYPTFWNKLNEEIPALYLTTSNLRVPVTGKAYFSSQGNNHSLFNSMKPEEIEIGSASFVQHEPHEQIIIQNLLGQIDNYIPIRNSRIIAPKPHGEDLFAAACYYCHKGNHEKALITFKHAVINGGYNNKQKIVNELQPNGELHAVVEEIKELLQSYFQKGDYKFFYSFFKEILAEIST